MYNPATEELLATIDTASKEDVDVAVKAGRKAFETTWGTNTPARERGRLLFKFADIIEENAGESLARFLLVRSEVIRVTGRWGRVGPRKECGVVGGPSSLLLHSTPSGYSRTEVNASSQRFLRCALLGLADIIVKVEAANSGKPEQWSRAELSASLQAMRFFAGAADKIAGSTIEVDDKSKSVVTRREPLGVVAQIVPWSVYLSPHV